MNKLFVLILAGLCSQGFCMNFDPYSSTDNLYQKRSSVSDIIAHFDDTLDNLERDIKGVILSNGQIKNNALVKKICYERLSAIARTRYRIHCCQDENTNLICILSFLHDSKDIYDLLRKL